MNYGGIEDEFSNIENSRIVILPIPYDGTSTWVKGADKGPEAILEASANMELYDIETDTEVYLKGIHTAEAVKENESPETMTEEVERRVREYLGMNKFVVSIGGEHSVSIGAMKAHAAQFDDLTILQIDAHADLRDEYLGSNFNHACVMARAMELCPVVQVGIRSMSVEEKDSVKPERVFYAHHIQKEPDWKDQVIDKLTHNVYLTIDLDAFDPAVLPATGTPEPGGLSWYDVLDLIYKVNKSCNIVGFDVVELCPGSHSEASDFLASKLIYRTLSMKFNK